MMMLIWVCVTRKDVLEKDAPEWTLKHGNDGGGRKGVDWPLSVHQE